MKSISLEANRDAEGPRTEQIKGVEFRMAVSPYFFPQRLDCEHDESSGELTITLVYPDQERGERVKDPSGLVELEIGIHTGRLLAVHIAVDKRGLDRVPMLVTEQAVQAIERLQDDDQPIRRNYQHAAKIFATHGTEIASAAPA